MFLSFLYPSVPLFLLPYNPYKEVETTRNWVLRSENSVLGQSVLNFGLDPRVILTLFDEPHSRKRKQNGYPSASLIIPMERRDPEKL